jgi:putative protease
MNGEVLAPGGGLDHALWALEGGAQAVYVGFQKFSARSHAENLTLDDVAALTAAAAAKGARIYCALNTILTADEVAEAVALAWQLHFRGVAALIVQDLGLALALVRHGPPVALHASTQAAVHTPGGVAALKALGFRRVVLARELTMAEIGRIVASDPEMEYEVFVHGALCYAVSGNCMASGMMIGRSANRGDCGQVCRTKFELDYLIPGPRRRESPHEDGIPAGVHAPPGEETWKAGTTGAFASMNDLELGPRVRELRALGVTSFKIEGRMKPPAYTFNTARAYRAFLEGDRDTEAWAWLDEARLRFGRLPSAGWVDGHKALAQTNPAWASSLGMPLGIVTGGQGTALRVGTGDRAGVFATLARGDGILLLGRAPGQSFRGALAGTPATKGGQTEVPLAEAVPFDPKDGTLWLLSRHDGKLPVRKAGRPWRHRIDLTLALEPAAGGVRFTVRTASLGELVLEETLAADPARGPGRLGDSAAEVFRASDSPFVPGDLTVDDRAGGWFVSPKVLKEFRRRWYALVEDRAGAFVAGQSDRVRQAAAHLPGPGTPPDRGSLSPLQGVNRLVGFVVDWDILRADHLAPTPWGLALPLPPFTPGEEGAFGRLRDFLVRLRDQGAGSVFPGLSNPGHLTWIRRLRAEGLADGSWFADWGFHCANPWTRAQLDQALEGFAFAVPWLEDPACPDKTFTPPLFTSRACMLRNSFGAPGSGGLTPTPGAFDSRQWIQARQAGQPALRPESGPRCPDGCAGQFSARLTQGKQPFRVEARDCINYLILETP